MGIHSRQPSRGIYVACVTEIHNQRGKRIALQSEQETPAGNGWPPGIRRSEDIDSNPMSLPCTGHNTRRRIMMRPNTKGVHTTMTTEIITAANKVIVVGMLDTMLVRDRSAKRNEGRKMDEVTKKSGRDWGRGGRWENMKFQV